MTEAKKLKPYREKTPVLCIYEWVGVDSGISRKRTSSLMVEVEFPDQVEDEFHRQIRLRYFNHSRQRGPRMIDWTLISVLTPKGNKV